MGSSIALPSRIRWSWESIPCVESTIVLISSISAGALVDLERIVPIYDEIFCEAVRIAMIDAEMESGSISLMGLEDIVPGSEQVNDSIGSLWMR